MARWPVLKLGQMPVVYAGVFEKAAVLLMAVSLGALPKAEGSGEKADRRLFGMQELTCVRQEQTRSLLKQDFCPCKLTGTGSNLYSLVQMENFGPSAETEILDMLENEGGRRTL